MTDPEQAVRFLEEHIPEMADAALRQAYWQALSAGSNVLVRVGNDLMEIHPDGSSRFIKPLPELVHVPLGTVVSLG